MPTLTCAGTAVPGLVIDLDASLVTCHSEKEQTAADVLLLTELPGCSGGSKA